MIEIFSNLNSCKRGIYGIFIIKDHEEYCAYIGRSEQLSVRAKQHKISIEKKESIYSLNEAYANNLKIEIRLIQEVNYFYDNYYKDAQRLASAECYWIDYYQSLNQCLEQLPEGSRPSFNKWQEQNKNKI